MRPPARPPGSSAPCTPTAKSSRATGGTTGALGAIRAAGCRPPREIAQSAHLDRHKLVGRLARVPQEDPPVLAGSQAVVPVGVEAGGVDRPLVAAQRRHLAQHRAARCAASPREGSAQRLGAFHVASALGARERSLPRAPNRDHPPTGTDTGS